MVVFVLYTTHGVSFTGENDMEEKGRVPKTKESIREKTNADSARKRDSEENKVRREINFPSLLTLIHVSSSSEYLIGLSR